MLKTLAVCCAMAMLAGCSTSASATGEEVSAAPEAMAAQLPTEAAVEAAPEVEAAVEAAPE